MKYADTDRDGEMSFEFGFESDYLFVVRCSTRRSPMWVARASWTFPPKTWAVMYGPFFGEGWPGRGPRPGSTHAGFSDSGPSVDSAPTRVVMAAMTDRSPEVGTIDSSSM